MLGKYSIGGSGTGIFKFGVFVGESIIEDFKEKGLGVGVGFILGDGGTGDIPGEIVPGEGGETCGIRAYGLEPVI